MKIKNEKISIIYKIEKILVLLCGICLGLSFGLLICNDNSYNILILTLITSSILFWIYSILFIKIKNILN